MRVWSCGFDKRRTLKGVTFRDILRILIEIMADNYASCDAVDLTKVMKALAYESGLIQAFGEKKFRRTDNYIKSRIPQKQGNADEGLNPREHIEYHFNGPNTGDDYTEIQSIGADTTANVGIEDGHCAPGESTDASIGVNNTNNLMCDPPTSTLNAGYNQYTGLQFVKAVETPVTCAFNLMRYKHLGFYIKGVRKAFPREMNVAYSRKLEELAVKFGRTNSAETCGPLLLGDGSFPAIPQGSADFGTFLQHAEALRGNGWTGTVIYGIGHSSLMNMIRNHKIASGLELNSTPFTTDDMALNAVPGDLVMIGDIGFKILTTPTRGYMQKIGTDSARFVRVDPRLLQPGSGAGITAEYDANYQSAWINCDGQQHRMVELSFFIHTDAAHTQPFAMKQIPGVEIDGRFNMEVKVIRGAYIECNKDDSKFLFRARHFFKFVPTDPRLMGAIAHLYSPYKRYLHVPEEDCDITPEVIEVSGPTLQPPLDNACCDVAAGSDPESPRPVQPTADDPDPENVEGTLITQCEILAAPGAETVTVCAERKDGSLGAASINWSLSDGTAVAATDYVDASGTLNWADGEVGIKCFEIDLVVVPEDAEDKNFFVDWDTVVGASASADMCTQSEVTKQPA